MENFDKQKVDLWTKQTFVGGFCRGVKSSFQKEGK